MDTTITIEALEALANQVEAEESAERARLQRLITSYACIVARKDPGQFKARALEHSDEDGHYDSSYPPKQEYKDRRGPRLLMVIELDTTDIAIEGGFYYAWRRETTDHGLYIARDGKLYGCTESGTGRLGQFAAHPGDCDVMCTLEWEPIDLEDVPLDRLHQAEEKLRTIAFPLVAARLAAAGA